MIDGRGGGDERRIEAACHADYGFRAMAGLYAGTGLTADTSARDVYSLTDDYVAVALTSITGHTADMRPDENARLPRTVVRADTIGGRG